MFAEKKTNEKCLTRSSLTLHNSQKLQSFSPFLGSNSRNSLKRAQKRTKTSCKHFFSILLSGKSKVFVYVVLLNTAKIKSVF